MSKLIPKCLSNSGNAFGKIRTGNRPLDWTKVYSDEDYGDYYIDFEDKWHWGAKPGSKLDTNYKNYYKLHGTSYIPDAARSAFEKASSLPRTITASATKRQFETTSLTAMEQAEKNDAAREATNWNALDFVNTVSGGGLNNLSFSQWIGRIKDTNKWLHNEVDNNEYINRWINGNNGVVSEEFEKEHPYWSMGINGVIDLAAPLAPKGAKLVPKFRASHIKPRLMRNLFRTNAGFAPDETILSGYNQGKQDLLDLFESPDYFKTLKQSGLTDEEAIDHILVRQNNVNTAPTKVEHLADDVAGGYLPSKHQVKANPKNTPNYESARLTGTHEYGHASTRGIDGSLSGETDGTWLDTMGAKEAEKADKVAPGTYAHEAHANEWNKSLIDLTDPENLSEHFKNQLKNGELDADTYYQVGLDLNGKLVLNDEAFTRARAVRARANAQGVSPDHPSLDKLTDNEQLSRLLSDKARKHLNKNVLSIPIGIGSALGITQSKRNGGKLVKKFK